MFSFDFSQKKKELAVGDIVLVGSTMNGKFVPIKTSAKVESIIRESTGCTRINLDWGPGFSRTRIYAHEEGKVWIRVENHN